MRIIAPMLPPLGRIRSVRQPEFSVTSPIMPATLSSPAPSFVWILSRPITPYIRDVMLKRSSITTAFDHITGCALKKVTKPLERRGLSLQMESRRCHSGFVGASSLRKWDPAPLPLCKAPLTPCLPPYPPAWPDSKLQTQLFLPFCVCVAATCNLRVTSFLVLHPGRGEMWVPLPLKVIHFNLGGTPELSPPLNSRRSVRHETGHMVVQIY